MNHILKLQNENANLKAQLKEVNHEISLFMVYLASPKFYGGENGQTTIQADEVFTKIRELRMMTLPE